MKIQIIDYSNEQPVIESKNGVCVWDGNGEEYCIGEKTETILREYLHGL